MGIKNGLILAGAAAALMASGFSTTVFAATDATTATDVKCVGGNACKGQSACKGKNLKGHKNSCKGQNSCKGLGYTKMSAEECQKVDGAKAEPLAEDKK